MILNLVFLTVVSLFPLKNEIVVLQAPPNTNLILFIDDTYGNEQYEKLYGPFLVSQKLS